MEEIVADGSSGYLVEFDDLDSAAKRLLYLAEHPNVRAVYIVDANPFMKNSKGLWLTEYLLNKNKTGKPVYFELNPE